MQPRSNKRNTQFKLHFYLQFKANQLIVVCYFSFLIIVLFIYRDEFAVNYCTNQCKSLPPPPPPPQPGKCRDLSGDKAYV